METVKDRLVAFLEAQVTKKKRVLSIMDTLESLVGVAEAGRWDLVKGEDVDRSAMARAIKKATGRKVKDLAFVSIGADCASQQDCAKLELYMLNMLNTTLNESLRAKWGEKIWRDLTDSDIVGPVSTFLFELFLTPLSLSVAQMFSGGTDGLTTSRYFIEQEVNRQITQAISSYVAFALSSSWWQRGRAKRLKPLLELLPKVIPLGEKKDVRGVWLVLVA